MSWPGQYNPKDDKPKKMYDDVKDVALYESSKSGMSPYMPSPDKHSETQIEMAKMGIMIGRPTPRGPASCS